jgi:hypothetical protein
MITNNNTILTANEKQKIWRKNQIDIFYGSGRPIFKITTENQFMRKNYDGEYYIESCQYNDLDNKNFIGIYRKQPRATYKTI